jgi:hypothetical protein
MIRRVALARTDTWEERIASTIKVTKKRLARNKKFLRSVLRLLITINVVPISPIPLTLMMVTICSSETSFLTRAKRRNIPEEAILRFPVSLYFCETPYI